MSIKLYIFCPSRSDSAPIQHEFTKALPLLAHIQKLCQHFSIQDASQYCLQVDSTKQYLTENDFGKGKTLTIPSGARIILTKSPKHLALDIIEKLQTLEPDKTKILLFDLYKKYLNDLLFLQNFIAADGPEAIVKIVLSTSGNTLNYALTAFFVALENGGGWNTINFELLDYLYTLCDIAKYPVNVITNTLRVLTQCAKNTSSVSFALLHSAALSSAKRNGSQPWESIVNLLDGEQAQQLKTSALELLQESLRSAGLVDQATQHEFLLLLQQLGLTLRLSALVQSYPNIDEEARLALFKLQRIRFDLLHAESAEGYDKNNPDHERLLMHLWNTVNPGVKLEARVCDQWKTLGFQQADPASDFRGMGLLGLKHLLYFATVYTATFKHMASTQASRSANYYPTSVAGINITQMLFGILEVKKPSEASPIFPIIFDHDFGFEELYCSVFQLFDKTWDEMEADYMDFTKVSNVIKQKCEESLQEVTSLAQFRQRNALPTLDPNTLTFPRSRLFTTAPAIVEKKTAPSSPSPSSSLSSSGSSSSLSLSSSNSSSSSSPNSPHASADGPPGNNRRPGGFDKSVRATAPPGAISPADVMGLEGGHSGPSSSSSPVEDITSGTLALTVYVVPLAETKVMLFEKNMSIKQAIEQIQNCSKKKIKTKKKGDKFGIYFPAESVWFDDMRKLWSFQLNNNDRIELKPRPATPTEKVVRIEISTGTSSYIQRIEFTPQTSVRGVLQAIDKQQSIMHEIASYGLFMKGRDQNSADIWLESARTLSSYNIKDQDLLEYKKKPEGAPVSQKIILTIQTSVSPTVLKLQFDTANTGTDVMSRVAKRLGLNEYSSFGLFHPGKGVWIGVANSLSEVPGIASLDKLEFKPRPDDVGPDGTLPPPSSSSSPSQPPVPSLSPSSSSSSLSSPLSGSVPSLPSAPHAASPPSPHGQAELRGGFGALAAQAAAVSRGIAPRQSCPVGLIKPMSEPNVSTLAGSAPPPTQPSPRLVGARMPSLPPPIAPVRNPSMPPPPVPTPAAAAPTPPAQRTISLGDVTKSNSSESLLPAGGRGIKIIRGRNPTLSGPNASPFAHPQSPPQPHPPPVAQPPPPHPHHPQPLPHVAQSPPTPVALPPPAKPPTPPPQSPTPPPKSLTPPPSSPPIESSPPPTPVSSSSSSFSDLTIDRWDAAHVAEWITAIGYPQHAQAFQTASVDGQKLLTEANADLLKSLGVSALGIRKEILRQIAVEKTKAGFS